MTDEFRGPPPQGRIPPQAVEVEEYILGACLTDREAFWISADLLTEEHFYSSKHRKIFRAMKSLQAESVDPDLVTVAEALRRSDHLGDVGGSTYLSSLTQSVATTSNVEYKCRIIQEKAMLRRTIEVATRLVGDAYDPAADAFEILEEAEKGIFQVRPDVATSVSLPDALRKELEALESIHGADRGVTGIPTGIRKIDELTTGWQDSDLIVIAARPSMGKTALALQCAVQAAKNEVPTAVFSMEMTAGQCARRMMMSEGRVNSQRARQGRLGDEDWQKLARAAGNLSSLPMHIDETPGLSPSQLRAKLRRLKADHDIGFAVVDYLQLMQASGKALTNRNEIIGEISRSVKGLAKELAIPIMLLSQLSRDCEKRGGMKRPMLSDLRDSGGIEQDADVVAFIYRAARYGIVADEEGDPTEGVAEILVQKQRNGPIGDLKIAFVEEYGIFRDLSRYPTVTGQAPPSMFDRDEYANQSGDAPF